MPLYTNIQKLRYRLPIFGKLLIAISCLTALFAALGHCCEAHTHKHQITYGDPKARFAVTQHFSLGSSGFIRFIQEEFPILKRDLIDTGNVSWTFCPDIADLLTLQFVSCLETLPSSKKSLFFESVLLALGRNLTEGAPQIFLRALEDLSPEDPQVDLIHLLEIGASFKAAGEFSKRDSSPKPPSFFVRGESFTLSTFFTSIQCLLK
ncbi:hypothetical protein [Candidatus Neptunochlamydia vexilliferae]|uniref:Secreted protein n=1 Tax=Candidatus Neptunichlamydia vexilliferae TaxID=1651774 RepID=A0ABS0B105_9BACT|nr:hypothetical protein [Candidatus Neptunochlamydia vexilliferae]MBF5060083.1 hypothetical protein [Candidatus Neptunochlamydia vexilliferae]